MLKNIVLLCTCSFHRGSRVPLAYKSTEHRQCSGTYSIVFKKTEQCLIHQFGSQNISHETRGVQLLILAESMVNMYPCQPPPFSTPSQLLILHGEAKSYCFIVSCVPGSMFNYF